MDPNMVSSIVRKVLERKVMKRLDRLTEEEVLSWRSGSWQIANEIIERYGKRLIDHRDLALKMSQMITHQEISREMVSRKPEFEEYWTDEVFFKRLSEEKKIITDFLKKNPS